MSKVIYKKTDHPHIVKIKGASNIWQAVIKGTYIRVWAIIGLYKRGMDEWEILKGFPTITPAELHDAISYYHDHKQEINRFIAENERSYLDYRTSEKGLKLADQIVSE